MVRHIYIYIIFSYGLFQVLYLWRDGQYSGETERLNKFIAATFEAKMFELREEMLANHLLEQ